jgi:hypothetical protein
VVASNEVIEYIAVSVVYSSFLKSLVIRIQEKGTDCPAFILNI